MGFLTELYDLNLSPNISELPGWNTNETIAESIINYALNLAETLESGKGTVDLNTILAYYDVNPWLVNQIRVVISAEITSGGYGLDPQDELDLWNRARDRENIGAQMALEEVKRNYSMSNFSMPSGALTKAMEKATGLAVEKNSSVNRDLAIKKADLYWEGKKFVFSLGATLDQLMLAIADAKGKIHTQLNGITIEAQARIIAAALSMMNMNASIGNHFSRSQNQSASASASKSISYSASDSFTTNYNYNYDRE